jgi:hypothetical protein
MLPCAMLHCALSHCGLLHCAMPPCCIALHILSRNAPMSNASQHKAALRCAPMRDALMLSSPLRSTSTRNAFTAWCSTAPSSNARISMLKRLTGDRAEAATGVKQIGGGGGNACLPSIFKYILTHPAGVGGGGRLVISAQYWCSQILPPRHHFSYMYTLLARHLSIHK